MLVRNISRESLDELISGLLAASRVRKRQFLKQVADDGILLDQGGRNPFGTQVDEIPDMSMDVAGAPVECSIASYCPV